MLPANLDDISLATIDALVANGLREGRTLDFKRDAVGGKDDDKREFLADISAFANTAGGDLLLGVEESAGEAIAVPGVTLPDPDAEIRRLDSILRAGLEPRLPRVDFRWLAAGSRGCLLVRVPRSFAAPHRVVFRDHGKFYGRNSGGKYPLDVAELRSAFLSANSAIQEIRRFRRERLALIEADEGAMPINMTAKLVFHIVPLSAFTTGAEIVIDPNRSLLPPLTSGSGFNTRHMLEGFATYVGREDTPETISSYTLLFRSGIVEAVSSVGHSNQEGSFVSASSVEWPLLSYYGHYTGALEKLGVEPPFYLFVSLLGVKGHSLATARFSFGLRTKLRQDALLLPEAVVTDAAAPVEHLLRSTFDLFWNAFGFPRSFSFDDNGKYIGEKY